MYLQVVSACGHIKAPNSKWAVRSGYSVLLQSCEGVEGVAESVTFSYRLNVNFLNLSNVSGNLFPQRT